jgi:hypothetical protein
MTNGRWAHWVASLAIAVLAGCSTTSETASPGPSGATGGGSSTLQAVPPPTCQLSCDAASDCGRGSGLEDASHFNCTNHRCEWLGCRSTAECTSAANSDKFVCSQEGGAPVPTCRFVCDTASDCGSPTSGVEDASHYQCTNHRCEWLGCRSTAECVAAHDNAKVTCSKEREAPIAVCQIVCDAAADCAPPGGTGIQDESHFQCTNHRCEWLGCRTTAECKTAFGNDKLVCR